MNEKFFDLNKEKQDRMLNAAMKAFAKEGYPHASTDDIVRDAHISKGLLFHYFESKLGLYTFLYEYCARFLTLEISTNVGKEETDFFTLWEQIVSAQTDAMRQYPYLVRFLYGAEHETVEEAYAATKENRMTLRELQAGIFLRADYHRFAKEAAGAQMTRTIGYIMRAVLEETESAREAWPERYEKAMREYLDMFRNLTYGEEAPEA